MSDNRTIRVVFFEPYPMGLSGNFLTQRLILERLNGQHICPLVVAPMEGVALDHFRSMGIACIVLPPPGVIGKYGGEVLRGGIFRRFKAAFDLLRYNFLIRNLLLRNSVDVIYTNCVRAQMSVGLGAKLARVPSLLYVKGELRNPVIDFLSLVSADRILFMCHGNLSLRYSKLRERLKSRISVLEGGLDPRELERSINCDKTDLRRELDIQATNFNVCVVGQICPMKGQHVVIKALSKLASEFENIRVYFVGDPMISTYQPYLDGLIRQVDELNLSSMVRFVGWRSDSVEIMACMDLLVNPSLAEGFGYVPLEGMAVGLPVISTMVGVLPEAIVSGRNGFLVDLDNDVAIVDHWRELMIDANLGRKIGREARKTIQNRYLIGDKVIDLASIWHTMVCEKKARGWSG